MRLILLLAAVGLATIPFLASGARAADDFGNDGFLSAPIERSGAEGRELPPDQSTLLHRIETYLNRFTTVKARFVQVSSDGGFAEGTVYLQRPGKMRFEYDPPTPVLLIADGRTLLYYDRQLKSASFVPLDETPLWFLMQPTISFDDRIIITDIDEELATVGITVRSEAESAAGEVTLIFSERPLALRKWVVTDAQGVTIQVSLLNPQFDLALDEELFQYGDLDVYGATTGGPER